MGGKWCSAHQRTKQRCVKTPKINGFIPHRPLFSQLRLTDRLFECLKCIYGAVLVNIILFYGMLGLLSKAARMHAQHRM